MDLFKLIQFAVQDANWVLQTVATFAAPSRQQPLHVFPVSVISVLLSQKNL